MKRPGLKAGFWELTLIAAPAIVLIFVFAYIPMFGVVMAFQKYDFVKGFLGSDFVGFKNFEFLFTTGAIWRVTWNTIFMNVLLLVASMAASLFIAFMMYEVAGKKSVKAYQTILVYPNFLSWVIAAYLFSTFLNPRYGLINQGLAMFGIDAVKWYSDPTFWPIILVVAGLWKGIGMGSLLYYAVLMSIDKDYYEAASIDGANKWTMIRKISFPFLLPTVTVLFILSVGGMVRADFGLFYFIPMDSKMLYSVTDVVDTYVFRALKTMNNPGMAAAAGLLQSVVGFLLVLGANAWVKKVEPDNRLF